MENRWQGEQPQELTDQAKAQLNTTAFVADTYVRYDENPVHDKAMNQPGVVETGSTRMTFEEASDGRLSAVLNGSDKEGRPVVVYLERNADTIEAYSIQNLGEIAYIQGGRTDGADGEGFYLSRAIDLEANIL